jgi:signal transduction histidine kinase
VSASDGGEAGVKLLSGPTGFSDVTHADDHLRALVMDRSEGRVVAMVGMAPYQAGRNRLLLALGFAELAGILASVAVVVLFTRRSARPLAQALELQRRFVADASHELRTPLTVLHTRAQMLARHAGAGDARLQQEAEALVADARVLGNIVDDLLASASMTSGASPRDRVDLAAVAASVRESIAPYAESIGVTLRFDADGTAEVLGSGAALRRALTALVDNALAHEHVGGTVDLRVRRDHEHVSVAVIDDGVGIDHEAMATLFTRFAHGSTHTSAGSRAPYGIGLALVREIAQAHGGDISVESTPGQRTTFTLTLPTAD